MLSQIRSRLSSKDRCRKMGIAHFGYRTFCVSFLVFDDLYHQEPLNASFLNGLFSSGFSRGKTAP